MLDSLESVVVQIDSIDREVSRRAFLGVALVGVAIPGELKDDTREFMARVAAVVIPDAALRRSGIDVVVNLERLLSRGSSDHRGKVLRFLAWTQRVSVLYGGPRIAVRGRTSHIVLVQKMSKALTALCMVAFWGDERALMLIDSEEGRR